MELKLTIDRGNTTMKGGVWDTSKRLLGSEVFPPELSAGEAASALLRTYGCGCEAFASAAYCTVVGSRRSDDMLSLRGKARRVINVDATTPMPMQILYATPATLGADRLAAALGAIDLAGSNTPLLVADIGTAATFDFVAPGAVYAGGNIAPGIGMRLKALHSYTAALPEPETDGPIPAWGKSTDEALRSGAFRGMAAELEYYHCLAGPVAKAVLTGGGAEYILKNKLLSFDSLYDPRLVLRGLNSIIDYNENR